MKAIKKRIKSVKNTRKITKTMEMIAASKMRKAIEFAINTRLYATIGYEVLNRFGEISELNYPLLKARKIEKTLLVVIGSNRGLCGSYNTNIYKKANQKLGGESSFSVLAVGKKGAKYAKMQNLPLISLYDEIGDNPTFEDAVPIARQIMELYQKGEFDSVMLVYTDFKSSMLQIPTVRTIMPFSKQNVIDMLENLPDHAKQGLEEGKTNEFEEYVFEPDVKIIVEYMVPRLVEIQVFQALLEASASEHSSRMIAMKNASEAAGEMIDSLTLEFNKARQEAITREVAEISSGAEALK